LQRGGSALSLPPMKFFALIALVVFVIFKAGFSIGPTKEEQTQ
jgi:hypothetical protein